jgi:glycogen phosphorylase
LRRFEATGKPITELASAVAMQLNDTHPAMAVAELMRLLIDEKELNWATAWDITVNTCAYTNHTLLPEALERWPVALFERVLPRHLQIIYEINHRFMQQTEAEWPGDEEKKRQLSIIEEADEQQVRMCNLAVVGSHSINGVSAMHSELVKDSLLPDFNQLWPERFNNKTNGITPRRWLVQCNPDLTDLIHRSIGNEWVTQLDQLQLLGEFADEHAFQDEFLYIKKRNKARLAAVIKQTTGVSVDPDSMFDVQVKRIHEYKRQLLNAIRIIHEYQAITEDGWVPEVPRTYVFSGKAAPGYWAAKQIIRLINELAQTINTDPCASQYMRVVFLPNYRVSLAERIFPASDLSEQISTAGYEASGTGNMKFMLNGAITMGTLDGANVEILKEVGPDNIFIFGKDAAEVEQEKTNGTYSPSDYYNGNESIRRVMDSLKSDRFCRGDSGAFQWIFDSLMRHGEEYYHLGDFESYVQAQRDANVLFADRRAWASKAIKNVATAGFFSSDRTIREYAKDIWDIKSYG